MPHSPPALKPSKLAQLIWTVSILAALPIIISALWFNYAAVVLSERRQQLFRRVKTRRDRRRILITGSSSPFGLDLARAFHKNGHIVIGVDAATGLTNYAKLSRSIARHHTLPEQSAIQDASYIATQLVKLIKSEKVHLWIDCSHDLSVNTITIARERLDNVCACIAIDRSSAGYLASNTTFHDFLRQRDLPAIEHHNVRSRGDIHKILSATKGKRQYLLQSSQDVNPRTLLPRRTLSQTYQDVSLLKITTKSQMSLEESLEARTVFQAFAVIVKGSVEYFSVHLVDGGLSSHLQHDSALGQSLKRCTESIAREFGHECTTNLTLTFRLDEKASNAGVLQSLAVARGSFRPDQRYAYARSSGQSAKLVASYLKALPSVSNGYHEPAVDNDKETVAERYTLSNLVTTAVVQPVLQVFFTKSSLRDLASQLAVFFGVISAGEEIYYDFRDPLPAFSHLLLASVGLASHTTDEVQ